MQSLVQLYLMMGHALLPGVAFFKLGVLIINVSMFVSKRSFFVFNDCVYISVIWQYV